MKRVEGSARVRRIALLALSVTTGLAVTGLVRRDAALAVQNHDADVACSGEFQELMAANRAAAGGRGGGGHGVVGSPPSEQKMRAQRCAITEDEKRRDKARGHLQPDFARLFGYHGMIPEYHDEQRLYAGTGTALGPQAGIYASPSLDDFTQLWQFESHGAKGVLVAYVVVSRLSFEPIPPTYQALGLGFGLNCVWLSRPQGAPSFSAVVRPAESDGTCNRDAAGGTPLNVVAQSLAGPNPNNYPAVARFTETTSVTANPNGPGNPLLGVKCLAAFCEIGPGTFTPRPSVGEVLQSAGQLSPSMVPRALVKGWHDEQLLSAPHWVNSSSYFFELSPVRAAIVPEAGVEALQESDFASWKPVATILLDADPPSGSKYESWGLKRGANRIELMHLLVNGRREWKTQMWPQGASVPTPWSFNKRERHFDVGIPGTVRFRWTIMDDGIWAPCGQSCCQVEG